MWFLVTDGVGIAKYLEIDVDVLLVGRFSVHGQSVAEVFRLELEVNLFFCFSDGGGDDAFVFIDMSGGEAEVTVHKRSAGSSNTKDSIFFFYDEVDGSGNFVSLFHGKDLRSGSEEVGFEPTDPFRSSVFETDAIGHSATLPM